MISAGNIVPLSTTMREEIGRMERWAYNRAIPASKVTRGWSVEGSPWFIKGSTI